LKNNPLDKIEKLSALMDKGIITKEEFDSKKQILLDSLSSCNKITNNEIDNGTYWLPVPSMILGIFVMLACFDESNWDNDTIVGAYLFIILSLILGIISVSIQKEGKGMAIAGITLSILSALIVIGSTQ